MRATASRPLRIGYVLGDGGVDFTRHEGCCIHVRHIVDGLRGAGHEVRFLAIQRHETVRLDTGEGLLPVERDDGKESGPIAAGELSEEVRRLAKEQGFDPTGFDRSDLVFSTGRRVLRGCDLIHARMSPFDVGSLLCARALGIPLVIEVNQPPVEEALLYYRDLFDWKPEQVARFAARYTMQEADAVLAVSSQLRELLVSLYDVDRDEVLVLPNAADPSPPAPSETRRVELRRLHGLGEGPVIVFVGALQPWHGLAQLVAAFARVRLRHPGAVLLIVGDGPERERLEQQIASLGLEQVVRRTGAVPHKEVAELLGVACIAVAPYPRLSQFYFSPLKVFEYMAAGRAIVASRIGQLEQVLAHEETALLVEPGQGEELVAALDRLLADPQLRRRLGEAAQRVAERDHTWSSYLRRLVAVYRDVLELRRVARTPAS